MPHAGRAGRIRLGRKDSNLRIAAPKAAAFPLGDAPLSKQILYHNREFSANLLSAKVSRALSVHVVTDFFDALIVPGLTSGAKWCIFIVATEQSLWLHGDPNRKTGPNGGSPVQGRRCPATVSESTREPGYPPCSALNAFEERRWGVYVLLTSPHLNSMRACVFWLCGVDVRSSVKTAGWRVATPA